MRQWALPLLRLGLLLAAIGFGPAVIAALVFPTADPLLPVMLALAVGPLAVIVLAASAIITVVGLLRR